MTEIHKGSFPLNRELVAIFDSMITNALVSKLSPTTSKQKDMSYYIRYESYCVLSRFINP